MLSFAAMCATFEQVGSLDLACPLIACGGIHTATQAQQILAAGASAIQIDSAIWIEPGLPARLAHGTFSQALLRPDLSR